MKNEEINRRIAEACGWERVRLGTQSKDDPEPRGWLSPSDKGDWRKAIHRSPDYCTDLNAMHEAEKIFDSRTSDEQSLYYDYLSLVVGWKGKTQAEARWEAAWNCLRATPAQKAKAFLMTIGKWEE
jgi:hypothetical protein